MREKTAIKSGRYGKMNPAPVRFCRITVARTTGSQENIRIFNGGY